MQNQVDYISYMHNIRWSIDYHCYSSFNPDDFGKTIKISGQIDINEQCKTVIETLDTNVKKKLDELRQINTEEIQIELEQLGINKNNIYLFIQGHIAYDKVVLPLLKRTCDTLRKEKHEEFTQEAPNDEMLKEKL